MRGFEYQMRAMEFLKEEGVSFHAALMAPGADRDMMGALEKRLRAIDRRLVADLETEEVTLYPHVRRRLGKVGISDWG